MCVCVWDVHVESKHYDINATIQNGDELSVECLCHGICVYVNVWQSDVWMSVSVSPEDRSLPRETARWRESKTQMTSKSRGKKENDRQMCWNRRTVMKMERLKWEKDICMVMQGVWLFSYLGSEGCSSYHCDTISNQLNNTLLLKMPFTWRTHLCPEDTGYMQNRNP